MIKECKKYYDQKRKALCYFQKEANPEYWDNHWNLENLASIIKSTKNHQVISILKKHLPNEKGLILEAGCGTGVVVHAMKYQGYSSVGIDFAKNTIKKIKESVSEIDVRFGDVRKLPFKDQEIACYISLGVIEHFWEGYDSIIKEAHRVLKRGGYAIISFPYMSPLRKIKTFLSLYPKLRKSKTNDNFYQFALDHNKVIKNLDEYGFQLIEKQYNNGMKGFRDEIPLFKELMIDISLGKKYKWSLPYLSRFMNSFAAHGIYLILKKK